MTRRRALSAALLLLLGTAAWAGGWFNGNPTTLRPHILTAAVRPSHIRPSAARTGRAAAPAPAPAAPRPAVLALRGVTVAGDVLDLSIPDGLLLTDPLPVPLEPLADLEIDLSSGLTLEVAIDDPDAAAEAGAVIFDGPVAGLVVVAARE